jgi:hypothetical protein
LQHINENNKLIRLIFRGQILKDEEKTLVDYKIDLNTPVYIHCAISESNCHYEVMTTIKKNNSNNINRGFDKLKESGYNEEEIRSIRTRFHQLHSTLDYIDGGMFPFY